MNHDLVLPVSDMLTDTTEVLGVTEIPQTVIDMTFLSSYYFPVEEREVLWRPFNDYGSTSARLTRDYKAISRIDNGSLISIMKKSYNMIENKRVIDTVMNELIKLNTPFYVDKSHSFVMDNRMKLHITFPEIRLLDKDSEIPLSVYIHNSYDGSEGVRILWGAIRAICMNGMIWGKVLSKIYRRHTKNMRFDNIGKQLAQTVDKLPVIQNRINVLEETLAAGIDMPDIKKYLGATIHDHVQYNMTPGYSMWDLYNCITYYISHNIEQRMRTHYQLQLGKVFNL